MLLNLIPRRLVLVVDAHAPLQNAALLDGAAGHHALMALRRLQRQAVAVAIGPAVRVRGRQVGDRVWAGVLDADACDAHIRGFACLAKGVVAAVKVLALLALLTGLGWLFVTVWPSGW